MFQTCQKVFSISVSKYLRSHPILRHFPLNSLPPSTSFPNSISLLICHSILASGQSLKAYSATIVAVRNPHQ